MFPVAVHHLGADLSDYFNYGFNEETWKAYCEKQRRLQLGLEPGAPLNSENKITVGSGGSKATLSSCCRRPVGFQLGGTITGLHRTKNTASLG